MSLSILGIYVADLVFFGKKIPIEGETILGNKFIVGPGGKGSNQSVAASILSIHNLYHQKRLMTEMREAIIAGNFSQIYGFCLHCGIRSLAKLPLFSRYVSSMG